MPPKAERYYTASDMRTIMRKKYEDAEWVLMFEVLDAVGGRNTRSADAIAMNTWPSRGLAIHGHEIKVARNDWLREKADPSKADKIARFCDYWWIVAPEHVLDEEELPEPWGWMVPAGKSLKVKKQAAKLEAIPLSRHFVASMMRNAGRAGADDIEQIIRKRMEDAEARIEKRIEERVKYATRDFDQLKHAVAEFEKASGVKIDTWSGGYVGKHVKMVTHLELANEWENMPRKLTQIIDQLVAARGIAKEIARNAGAEINLPKEKENELTDQ